MYFMAPSFSGWSPIRQTASDEIDRPRRRAATISWKRADSAWSSRCGKGSELRGYSPLHVKTSSFINASPRHEFIDRMDLDHLPPRAPTDELWPRARSIRCPKGSKDVGIWGRANVIRQYLKAGLLDEMQVH